VTAKNALLSTLLAQARPYLPHAPIGLGLYLLLVVTAALYWPGLTGDLLLDDYENLRPLQDFDLGTLTWREAALSNHSGPLGRPLSMLTFVGNVAFSGKDVWALKYTNLMIHLLCGTLIFWLSGRLFKAKLEQISPLSPWALALAVAGMWLLAPLLVSTTLYVVQRMAQLAALFNFVGLLSYVIGRQNLGPRPTLGWSLIASSLLIWLPLSALSKESGLLLPLLMLTVEVFVFRFRGTRTDTKALYTLFALTVALPAIVALVLLSTSHSYLLNYINRPFSLGERLLTQARVLFFYAGNLLVPQGPGMGLYHDDYSISRGLFEPWTTLIALGGWLALLAMVPLARCRRWWPLLFGPCFFLAGHALESSIFSLELVFEHRNYLPAFGIFFSLVFGLALLVKHIDRAKPILVLLLLLPATYGFATFQRTQIWASWADVLLTAEQTHPNSPRVHIDLASLHSLSGNHDDALASINRAERLRIGVAVGAAFHRFLVHCKTGRPIPSELYEQLPKKLPEDDTIKYAINVFRAIASEARTGKCPQLDIDRFTSGIEDLIDRAYVENRKRGLWDIHYHMAHIYRADGRLKEAIRQLKLANRRDPSRPEALLTMMQYQLSARDYRGARHTLSELQKRFRTPTARYARLISQFESIISSIEQLRVEARK